MRKINVILRNEDIDPSCVTDKVVVVINALFCTSAVIHALAEGAEAVHVQGCWQATGHTAARLSSEHQVIAEPLAAESGSRFANHAALAMDRATLAGYALVLTCRATSEALYMASTAAQVYVAALLNAPAMATRLLQHENQPLELICTGPGGRPSLVDLYTAGYLVEHLMQHSQGAWLCSDSALMARAVYRQYRDQPRHCIDDSLAATLLASKGLATTAKDICELGRHDVVAQLDDGALVSRQPLRNLPATRHTRTHHYGL